MMKVLLVDDEPTTQRLVTAVLNMHGYAVSTANSAQEAIPLLVPDAFDIVVTDLRMETPLAGFEVVAAAKRLAPRPIIVILTAFPVPVPDWQNAAGADALCVKGAGYANLPNQLKDLLQQQSPAMPLPWASGE